MPNSVSDARISDLQAEKAQLYKRRSEQVKDLNIALKSIDMTGSELIDAKRQIDVLNETMHDLKNRQDNVNQEIKNIDGEIKDIDEEIERLKSTDRGPA